MRPYKAVRFKGSEDEISAQWRSARKDGVGGSDAAAVLGLNPYATPYTVWLEKTGRMVPEDISEKESVYWGTVLEDVIAREFQKRHPEMKVKRSNAMLWSTEHPFMFASVDRIITDESGRRGILEIKTAGERRKGDWEDGVPNYYLPQVTHYLAVTGFHFFAVAVLIGGQTYREFTCERDEEDIDALVSAERRFWERVKSDTPPDAMGGRAESDAILEQHPEPDDQIINALDEDVPEIGECLELNAKIKEMETERSRLINAIKLLIGDRYGIRTPRYRVTWPRARSSRFDSGKFQRENPDLYEKYVRETTRDMGVRISEKEM